MIRERGAGPVEGVELRGIEAARPTPEVLDAIARAEAIVIGPSNPVISIGPILAVPGLRDALRGRARAGRRGLAARPRRGAQGPDRRLPRLGGPPAHVGGDRRALRGRARRPRGRRARRVGARRWSPTSRWATRTRAAAWPATRCDSRVRAEWLVLARAHRRRPAGQVLRARQAAARRSGRRRRARGAGGGDGERRAERARGGRGDRRDRRGDGRAAGRAGRGAGRRRRWSTTPSRPASRRPPRAGSTPPSCAAPTACCSSPATARRSTRPSWPRLLGRRDEPPHVVIVPDRHGSGTNALLLAPPSVVGPSFGAGSFARHAAQARAAGATVKVSDLPSLGLDVDTPDDLAALRAALDAAARPRAAHPRGARPAGPRRDGVIDLAALPGLPEIGPGDDLAALLAEAAAAHRRPPRHRRARRRAQGRLQGRGAGRGARDRRARPGGPRARRRARQGPAHGPGHPRRVRARPARRPRPPDLPHPPRLRVRERGRRRLQRRRARLASCCSRATPTASARALQTPARLRRRHHRLVRPRLAPRPVRGRDRLRGARRRSRTGAGARRRTGASWPPP